MLVSTENEGGVGKRNLSLRGEGVEVPSLPVVVFNEGSLPTGTSMMESLSSLTATGFAPDGRQIRTL